MIKKDLDTLKINPFDFFGKGHVLVTAGDIDERNSMTIAWGTIGTLFSKKVAIIFIKESRFTNHLIQKSLYFTLSFLSNKYNKELGIMGTLSGKDCDKYKLTGLNPVYDNDKFCSYIKESDMVFKCKKISELKFSEDAIFDKEIIEKYYSGTDSNNFHHVYVGEIVSYLVKED